MQLSEEQIKGIAETCSDGTDDLMESTWSINAMIKFAHAIEGALRGPADARPAFYAADDFESPIKNSNGCCRIFVSNESFTGCSKAFYTHPEAPAPRLEAIMAKCGMCMGRGSYDDPPWGIRVCVLCHGTGHDDPGVELWDRKGNVQHSAVERFGEARAQMKRIEQEHAAKSEFQREVEKLGASAATVAEPSDQFEHLDLQNHQLRRAMQKMMARLTELLDEDKFAEIEAIATGAGVEPPQTAQQQAEPGADERVLFETTLKRLAEMPEDAHEEPYPSESANGMWALWKAARAAQSGQRAGVAKSEIEARMRAAGLGTLLSEVYARASGLLDEDQCERVEQALIDHERAIAAAPTQQQEGEQ